MSDALNTAHLSVDPATEYFFDEGCYILELSNSAADPDLSVARVRLPVGGSTRKHRLIQTTERYVILKGEGLTHIGAEASVRVLPGDVVLIPPGIVQSITNTGSGDLVFLAICTPRFEKHNYQDDDFFAAPKQLRDQ